MLPCESIVALYNSHLPTVFVQSDLGMDAATLRTLPGTNPLFYLTERDWLLVQVGPAVLITLGALILARGARITLARFSPVAVARGVGHLIGGITLFAGVWFVLLFAFLASGLVD